MKVKPLYSYSAGVLVDAEGNALAVRSAQMQAEYLFDNATEGAIAALALEGANFLLLRVRLAEIAPAPDTFNEAALARLRELLKKTEEKRVAVVLSIESEENPAVAGSLFIDAAEHAARRVKDCSSLIGFAVPQWAGGDFLLEMAARLEKKHPTLLFFIPPNSKSGEAWKRGGESGKDQHTPFVAPDFWPCNWL